ncbi:MAG: hypothetical protein GX162_11525 [Firmicutes bacterium]|nr:hypothetical protein [Bacillota bacterium]
MPIKVLSSLGVAEESSRRFQRLKSGKHRPAFSTSGRRSSGVLSAASNGYMGLIPMAKYSSEAK